MTVYFAISENRSLRLHILFKHSCKLCLEICNVVNLLGSQTDRWVDKKENLKKVRENTLLDATMYQVIY